MLPNQREYRHILLLNINKPGICIKPVSALKILNLFGDSAPAQNKKRLKFSRY